MTGHAYKSNSTGIMLNASTDSTTPETPGTRCDGAAFGGRRVGKAREFGSIVRGTDGEIAVYSMLLEVSRRPRRRSKSCFSARRDLFSASKPRQSCSHLWLSASRSSQEMSNLRASLSDRR
jgi:hypothetical protein